MQHIIIFVIYLAFIHSPSPLPKHDSKNKTNYFGCQGPSYESGNVLVGTWFELLFCAVKAVLAVHAWKFVAYSSGYTPPHLAASESSRLTVGLGNPPAFPAQLESFSS